MKKVLRPRLDVRLRAGFQFEILSNLSWVESRGQVQDVTVELLCMFPEPLLLDAAKGAVRTGIPLSGSLQMIDVLQLYRMDFFGHPFSAQSEGAADTRDGACTASVPGHLLWKPSSKQRVGWHGEGFVQCTI